MKMLKMAAATVALMVGMSPAMAQTAPQTTPDQTMPAQPDTAQTAPDQTETQSSPSMQAPDASTSMSDADKRKITSCMKKSPKAMMKDKKCAAMMEAHPDMTTPTQS